MSDPPPLSKYLASTDKKTRDKAVTNLSIFLSDPSRDALPKDEMDKLWKGIFYCFWMSDKPLVQQALADELAALVSMISTTSASLAFLRGFWETSVGEWNGIDRLRIDKYYLLVRRFVNASFKLLIHSQWDRETCSQYNSILSQEGGPLCPTDMRVPTGLTYHLADIYLDELDKAMASQVAPFQSAHPIPVSTLLEPFVSFVSRTPNSTSYQRVQSALFEPLFQALSIDAANDSLAYPHLIPDSSMDGSETGMTMDQTLLKKQLLQRWFTIASDVDTRDANRRKMYAFWKSQVDDEDSERE